MERHFAAIPDPYIQAVQREVVPDGVESPRFRQAIVEFSRLISDLDSDLGKQRWIVGERLSLADIAYAPYATRLDHLGLTQMWQTKPHFTRWYEQIKKTEGYRAGLADWFNPKYLPLMAEAGAAAWPRVRQILDSQ